MTGRHAAAARGLRGALERLLIAGTAWAAGGDHGAFEDALEALEDAEADLAEAQAPS